MIGLVQILARVIEPDRDRCYLDDADPRVAGIVKTAIQFCDLGLCPECRNDLSRGSVCVRCDLQVNYGEYLTIVSQRPLEDSAPFTAAAACWHDLVFAATAK